MKRARLLLPFLVLITIASSPAATVVTAPTIPPTLKPATNGSRFLFVLDMSSAMKASDEANRQALFDLIFTGFDGQMRHGDSFGLWLYSDEIRAGEFPLQIWDEQNPLEVASRTAQFVRAQKYAGKAQLDEVMPKLLQLSRVVRDVHLVLISTGEQPIAGTPFDASLNEACGKKQAQRRKEKKPIITTLNVRTGQVISASVTLAGQFIQLPERPVPPVVVATAPAPVTNRVAAPTPNPRPQEEPKIATTPTAPPGPTTKTWTPEAAASVAASPAATNPAPAARPKVLQFTTVSNAAVVQTAPPEASPPQPPPAQSAPVVPSAPAVAAVGESPAPAALAPTAATGTPEPLSVTAREPAAVRPSTALPATVVYVQPGTSPTLLLAIGATLLAACLTLLILVLRRLQQPVPGSFITRSMDRR